ncbi:DNA-directed DNA polymerase II small subunit [Candidatus Micrarchaeota archaeon]|nr:DNA-directed DNA polymerase II small subunit [Candidatus Micrarchaeota archaeon]
MLDKLVEKGIRVSVDAEELLAKTGDESVYERLLSLGKLFISRADVEGVLSEKNPDAEAAEFRPPSAFRPQAKEYGADLKIMHNLDVTGKSRTRGELDNFVNYFRNRFERLSRLLRQSHSNVPTVTLEDAKKHVGDRVRVLVMITEKRETKKGNTLFEVEDLTGTFKVVFSQTGGREKLMDKSRGIILDDVVALTGKILEPYMIAEEVDWPDTPVVKEKKLAERDVAVAYLSDLHFGSNNFMKEHLDLFVKWLCGEGETKELAGKVKYVIIAGDIVDGIGIYPNQERELVVKDVYKQYGMFDDFVSNLPDYVEIIVGPGNHDAVRRGDPMPAIGDDCIKSDVTKIGSPSMASIEGMKHLVYHGTSIDSMIASIPGMSYMHPEKVAVEFLKRRHLSPVYGGNLIIPEDIDYMVVEEPPDVVHCGHIHKNGYAQYRSTLVINSGTFQSRTEYQIKQGHVPTPALVPVYELKTGKLRTLDFRS